jgi:hypothetical protein
VTLNRTRLRCNEKECPAREDEDFHKPACLSIKEWNFNLVEHSDEAQHQHIPKRSQGGKTVRVVLCSWCHDRIDNGPWGNSYFEGEVRIFDYENQTLLRIRPLASTGEAQGRSLANGELERDALPSPAGAGASGPNVGHGDAEPAITTVPEPAFLGGGEDVANPPASPPPPYSFHGNGIEWEPEYTLKDWRKAAREITRESERELNRQRVAEWRRRRREAAAVQTATDG